MIRVTLCTHSGQPCGFTLRGHAGSEWGKDIVCAAVSSAAYMTANTLTDVCACKATVTECPGYMDVKVPMETLSRAADILQGFFLHMRELERQYPRQITCEKEGS